jgi:hypothetical protein
MNREKIENVAMSMFSDSPMQSEEYKRGGYDGFILGAEWAVRSAAGGFEEWFNPSREVPEILKEASAITWKAATLAAQKKFQDERASRSENIRLLTEEVNRKEERIKQLEYQIEYYKNLP